METATVTVVDLRAAELADGAERAGHATAGVLTEREQAILSFERTWYKHAGGKEQALLDLFGMSATRYFQVLNALIDRPEALAQDPMLVKRLRRMRQYRQQARSSARRGNS
jgi:Protein of unknown function (DUF3263)